MKNPCKHKWHYGVPEGFIHTSNTGVVSSGEERRALCTDCGARTLITTKEPNS